MAFYYSFQIFVGRIAPTRKCRAFNIVTHSDWSKFPSISRYLAQHALELVLTQTSKNWICDHILFLLLTSGNYFNQIFFSENKSYLKENKAPYCFSCKSESPSGNSWCIIFFSVRRHRIHGQLSFLIGFRSISGRLTFEM